MGNLTFVFKINTGCFLTNSVNTLQSEMQLKDKWNLSTPYFLFVEFEVLHFFFNNKQMIRGHDDVTIHF